ncbi:MAG TPA: GcrA family cell cycle regulator [Candidatus Paceibacterota bacterium]
MSSLLTENDKRTIKKLWPTNSASEIGALIGRTRNSVIGAVHRMKLPPKKTINQTEGGGRPKAEPQFIPKPPRPKAPAPTEPQSAFRVSLMDARADQCKAIVGSTDDPNGLATVCGGPVPEGQAYEFCAFHLAKYTQPPRSR